MPVGRDRMTAFPSSLHNGDLYTGRKTLGNGSPGQLWTVVTVVDWNYISSVLVKGFPFFHL